MGTSWLGPIKELLFIPSNQYRLFLSLAAQLLGQWSGANSITIVNISCLDRQFLHLLMLI